MASPVSQTYLLGKWCRYYPAPVIQTYRYGRALGDKEKSLQELASHQTLYCLGDWDVAQESGGCR